MIIRNLKTEDASQVALLIPQLTKNIIKPEQLLARIELLSGQQNCQYLVADEKGKIVGFGGLAWYPIPSKGLIAWLEEIVVDEHFRGQGIAKSLIKELLDIAQQKSIKTVKLTSVSAATNSLYEKFGFIKKDHEYFIKKLDV